MTIRVNTLGKSAIINRQLNSAYDIVEYVADNLPFLLDLMKKIDTIRTILETYEVANHIADNSIHLSENERNALASISTLANQISLNSEDIRAFQTSLAAIQTALNQHINNTEAHVTQADKDRWNSYEEVSDEHIAEVVTPIVNTAVNGIEMPSIEPLEQDIADIQGELGDCLKRENLHDIAFSGNYRDLEGVPKGDNNLSLASSNWVKNKVVTQAIQNISGGLPQALTNAEIDAIIEGLNNDN
jgi:hypothetical protein